MPDKAIKKTGQPSKLTGDYLTVRNFNGGICGYVCQDYLHIVKKKKMGSLYLAQKRKKVL